MTILADAYSALGQNDNAVILELLYEKDVDVFGIVSSDSDFTRLAKKLRKSGKTVVGKFSKYLQNKVGNAKLDGKGNALFVEKGNTLEITRKKLYILFLY